MDRLRRSRVGIGGDAVGLVQITLEQFPVDVRNRQHLADCAVTLNTQTGEVVLVHVTSGQWDYGDRWEQATPFQVSQLKTWLNDDEVDRAYLTELAQEKHLEQGKDDVWAARQEAEQEVDW